MDLKRGGLLAGLAAVLALPGGLAAQSQQSGGTLVIAGQAEQAPLIRIRGKSYVDVESLARITHGSVRYQGSQVILNLSQSAGGGDAAAAQQSSVAVKPPRLSANFLATEVETLTAIRDWHAALVNAVQNNYPVTDDWASRLRRTADTKLQLAVAAATTDPDQRALGLLRNEYSSMQQMSEQFVAMHAKVNYISPDSFANNALDAKIVGCEQALRNMAATKEFQDDISCH